MPKFLSSDELKLVFSSVSAADGRFYSEHIVTGSAFWTLTVHNLPLLSGIRVEVNNSRYRPEGNSGFVNPIFAGLQSSVCASHYNVTVDNDFANNWVPYSGENEFSLSAGFGSLSTMKFGFITSDTGTWPGTARFIRLSMTGTPRTSPESKAYFFDSAYL